MATVQEKATKDRLHGNNNNNNNNNADRYLCLVEFSHKHLDFLIPELISVLDMHGIRVETSNKHNKHNDTHNDENYDNAMTTCRMIALPNAERYQQETKAAPRRAFTILSFSKEWFREQQQQQQQENSQTTTLSIATILSRCVLVRRVIELWGTPGTTIEETAQNTQRWIQGESLQSTNQLLDEKEKEEDPSKNNLLPEELLGPSIYKAACDPSETWKFTIHTLGSKFTLQEHDAMRSQFSFLNFPGRAQMKHPSHEFLLIREIELDGPGSPLYPRHGHTGVLIPEHDQRLPLACYFGRVLTNRETLQPYNLKQRKYLGPTSMDAELSFIMSNLGQVQKSSVVLDPFVGTGSILVACAKMGAFCVGTDIDIRVLRGRNKDENVYSNFAQFHLPRPELIRSDNAIYHRHFRSHDREPWVDAIVTDPPYGIRAGARKSGSRLEQVRPVLDEHRHDHIAQTKPYDVGDVMADLLDVAARVLVMRGRLVYVIPSFATDFSPEEDLPRHECLALIHLSYQSFTPELGRRIVTMKKIKPYDPKLRDSYLAKTWKNGPASAEKCANIRDKILEAAKQKPDYEEKSKIRKQKRREHKQAKKRAKLEHAKQVEVNEAMQQDNQASN